MTRYEYGFLNKCAERGIDGRAYLAGLHKSAQDATPPATPPAKFSLKDWSGKNPELAGAAAGGVGGAGLMALYEALRPRKEPDERKDYLKKILIGLVGGVGIGAAAGHWGPHAYDRGKIYFDRGSTKAKLYYGKGKEKAKHYAALGKDYFQNLGTALKYKPKANKPKTDKSKKSEGK